MVNQNRNQHIKKLTIAGMLIAVGIIIPMFSPVRIMIEPASYTLASHVVIFIGMFISPLMAVAVVAGTTIGFQLGGFPIVVVLRAASHVFFASIGAYYLHRIVKEPLSGVKARIFSFIIALIHALFEVAVVTVFFFGDVNPLNIEQGFLTSIVLLVGLGTVIHSMIDYEIARFIVLPLKKQKTLAALFKKV